MRELLEACQWLLLLAGAFTLARFHGRTEELLRCAQSGARALDRSYRGELERLRRGDVR